MIHSKVSIWKLLAIPVLVLGMAFLITGHVKAQDVVPVDPIARQRHRPWRNLQRLMCPPCQK